MGASEKQAAAFHPGDGPTPPAPEYAPTSRCVMALNYPDEVVGCHRDAVGWAWFPGDRAWGPTCSQHSEVRRG